MLFRPDQLASELLNTASHEIFIMPLQGAVFVALQSDSLQSEPPEKPKNTRVGS